MPSLKTSTLLAATGVAASLAGREWLARRSEESLTGQVALVTGGSRGLGYLLARELAREGCRVVICARDEGELTRAAAALDGQGAEVLAIRCDVGDREDVARMVDEAERHFGPVEILVNNAGIIQTGPVWTMTHEDFQRAMDVMYWGVVNPTLALLPGMRERRRGRIINVTSIGGKVAVPHLLPYSGAKFAATGFSEGLRAELAGTGISVTTVAPGLMRTGSYLNAYYSGDEEGREAAYKLFAPLSSLPLLTASGESAARAYVRAIRRGMGEYIYPPQFGLVARLHGLAPATTARVLGWIDRILPKTAGGTGTEPGMKIDDRMEAGDAWRASTTLGREAAETFKERPGPTSVPEPE